MRGRPPLPRNVFSFESFNCPLPDKVTLDTSFVVNALMSGEKHHHAAQRFLERLAENNTFLVYNHLLELELREVAFMVPIRETFRRDWRSRRHDGRTLRRARWRAARTMDAWNELLTAFAWAEVQVDAVQDRLAEMMGRGMASYDAVHAATAETYGGGQMVTTDVGFAWVPQTRLSIFTDTSRLGSCRRVRGARR